MSRTLVQFSAPGAERFRQRDGTSQDERRSWSLDPSRLLIDGRTTRELFAFVESFAEHVRYLAADEGADAVREAGTWAPFVRGADVSVADVAAYVEHPERFDGERARWLGRPHFGLLLTFLELLGLARDQLNGLTRRHLEYYFREVLAMRPKPAIADWTPAVFTAAPRAPKVWVPAGTELQAGRDSTGRPRIYRTARDLWVGHAQVSSVRSVFADRRRTRLADVRRDRSSTPSVALSEMLQLALGSPNAGDPVPPFDGARVDGEYLATLYPILAFARDKHVEAPQLFLEHHELRSLLRLKRRRDASDPEWREINRLLGVPEPARPRDFEANLLKAAQLNDLHFESDGWPEIEDIDDLYEKRFLVKTVGGETRSVKRYIETRLARIGYESFVALMPIKLRIDAEWAEINRLLERAGRRRSGLLSWALLPGSATRAQKADFDENLRRALEVRVKLEPRQWPVGLAALPSDGQRLEKYVELVERLERHFSLPAERVADLSAFASSLDRRDDALGEIERLLGDAHAEAWRARRRARLEEVRSGRDTPAGCEAVASFALGATTEPLRWDAAVARLTELIGRAKADLLDRFHRELSAPFRPSLFGWPDAYRLFELAQRRLEGIAEPVAEKIEWHNLYAYEDATKVLADPERSTRWSTFGGRPVDAATPGAPMGFAVQSPLLSLSQGRRTITLTIGLEANGFDRAAFLKELKDDPTDAREPTPSTPEQIRAALDKVLLVEGTTAKGWTTLRLVAATLATGKPGDDYGSLIRKARGASDQPALQLVLAADVADPPLAPAAAPSSPTLRVCLRQIRDEERGGQWRTRLAPFEPLRVSGLHLAVEVDGLTSVALQQDDRALDPRKPFEPFGSRPGVGARLYVAHPELVRAPLETLRFTIRWMGLPGSLPYQYYNYPVQGAATPPFKVAILLADNNVELPLDKAELFSHDGATAPSKTIEIGSVPAAIERAAHGYVYGRQEPLGSGRDLRTWSRYLIWELDPVDFGHSVYPAVAAEQARALAVELAKQSANVDAKKYRVDAPYTPSIKSLEIRYTASSEVTRGSEDLLLHVHPFGVGRFDWDEPTLMPRYEGDGELYLGLSGVHAPEKLSLWLQLAEGTSDPDVTATPVTWAYLSGDRWLGQPGGGLLYDETRGLLNSGVVELALPEASASSLLPEPFYWLRVRVDRGARGVCDALDIRAQATVVRFDDRGNAPDHYDQPLPAGSIDRLVRPEAGIVSVAQPFTSFGGKPAERDDIFETRVSERLRHKNRALSPWDYERLVLQHFPQIYKAKCLRASAEPSSGHLDVIVIPDIRKARPGEIFGPKVPANVLREIEELLVARAPATASIHVRNARHVTVRVRLGVRFRPGQDEIDAKRRLNEDLIRFLSPWAFDEGADLMIGGRIYANSILDFVDRRGDVDYVTELKLFRSVDGTHPDAIPPMTEDYHVGTDAADQVLVSAPQHEIDVIPDSGYQHSSFTGINYMKIELDFVVA